MAWAIAPSESSSCGDRISRPAELPAAPAGSAPRNPAPAWGFSDAPQGTAECPERYGGM